MILYRTLKNNNNNLQNAKLKNKTKMARTYLSTNGEKYLCPILTFKNYITGGKIYATI